MFPKLDLVPRIAAIANENRLEGIFAQHRPALLLHAAAHKHVPMMEWNPSEAVKNNILAPEPSPAWCPEVFRSPAQTQQCDRVHAVIHRSPVRAPK